ncbi:MAG: leucine-rich repeat protein [Clostridia bacterium]|nr:leucine-rich repeat protein [Clostridia bacterium]
MKRTIKLLLVICCVAMAVMLSSCEWTWKGTEQAPTKATVKHSWIEADCENPRTCAKCGTTEGEALGHRPEEDDGNCVTDVLCEICDKVLTPGFAHTPFEDDGDCTTEVLCSVCNNVAIGAKGNHVGGSATCVSGEICETCGTEYGKVAPDNHSFDAELGECTECSLKIAIDATEMTPEELNAAVMYRLGLGIKDIHVTLVSTPEVEMFTAIRRALLDVKGLANGSITLTLAGVTVIPDHSTSASDGSAIFGRVSGDVDYTGDTILGRTVTAEENLLDLGSVNLPDVISIGQYAFYHCDYLTTLYAPKVQTIGMDAFAYTGLTSVELPEATTIGAFGFSACVDLTSVNLPKATSISGGAFLGCTKLTSVVLTAEGTVTLGTSVFGASDQCLAENIDLVLNLDKQSEVTDNIWNGYTFKSVQFPCVDGTVNHSFGYTDNGDGTHKKVCSECGYMEVDNEKHTAAPDSYDCICGATVIAVIDGTLGGKTEATEEDLAAMVELLRSYIENGMTTIIVTGSQPAKLLESGYLIPVVSLAFEQLTYVYQDENIDSYWGTVDLIYQDVTEIVEYEFYVCDVLKSITLPKVTKVGDRGFWACYYLETLTFGSVVDDITDNSGEVFYDLGYEIDGCNLVLNCGQLQAAIDYQPNPDTNTWWNTEWKSITLTHTGECDECKAQ